MVGSKVSCCAPAQEALLLEVVKGHGQERVACLLCVPFWVQEKELCLRPQTVAIVLRSAAALGASEGAPWGVLTDPGASAQVQ